MAMDEEQQRGLVLCSAVTLVLIAGALVCHLIDDRLVQVSCMVICGSVLAAAMVYRLSS